VEVTNRDAALTAFWQVVSAGVADDDEQKRHRNERQVAAGKSDDGRTDGQTAWRLPAWLPVNKLSGFARHTTRTLRRASCHVMYDDVNYVTTSRNNSLLSNTAVASRRHRLAQSTPPASAAAAALFLWQLLGRHSKHLRRTCCHISYHRHT